jgi:hypothetical protein
MRLRHPSKPRVANPNESLIASPQVVDFMGHSVRLAKVQLCGPVLSADHVPVATQLQYNAFGSIDYLHARGMSMQICK